MYIDIKVRGMAVKKGPYLYRDIDIDSIGH